jgi:DNA-binding PadR family transcriptional regulator
MKARLLILGVLHRGNFHPYEIKRRLENAMIECYTDVDVGTLYYAIRQLEKEDLISTVSRERVVRGGMRTIYKITTKGKTEFRELLHRQFEEAGPVSQTLYGALLFLHLSDLAAVQDLIQQRIARLDESITKLGPIRKELRAVISTGGDHLLRHLDMQRHLDRDWLKGLLVDVKARRVRDVADPNRLASGTDGKGREHRGAEKRGIRK